MSLRHHYVDHARPLEVEPKDGSRDRDSDDGPAPAPAAAPLAAESVALLPVPVTVARSSESRAAGSLAGLRAEPGRRRGTGPCGRRHHDPETQASPAAPSPEAS